jgi:hypothetical protein
MVVIGRLQATVAWPPDKEAQVLTEYDAQSYHVKYRAFYAFLSASINLNSIVYGINKILSRIRGLRD